MTRLVHPLRWILVVALGLILIALEPASALPSQAPPSGPAALIHR